MILDSLIKPNKTFSFTVENTDAYNRIDRYITKQFPYYSRSFFQRSIDKERISINDQLVTKQSIPVKEGDVVTITFPPARMIEPEKLAGKQLGVQIVGTHDHFMILYKPAGLLVHPPNTTSTEVTLVDWILYHYQELAHVGYVDRPGIVHRLDKNTSGILIIPRTNYAHRILGDLFKKRAINKTYIAVVRGHPLPEGTIDLPIGRNPITRVTMTTFPHKDAEKIRKQGGVKIRHAITHYKVCEYFDDAALVEIHPVTGRTHQIRVHFAAIGHPLIGDQLYGTLSKHLKRQALHAYGLSFIFNGKLYSYNYEMPDDLKTLVNSLRLTKKYLKIFNP